MADEFTDKLNAVLGNPEAMGQIMSIARALTGDGTPAPPAGPPPAEPGQGAPAPVPEPLQTPATALPAPAAPEQPAAAPDLSGILSLLGGLMGGGGSSPAAANPLSALSELDPRLIQMGMRLIQEYNAPNDDKAALLAAMRPFVREERFAKVDRAIQIARLARVVRMALRVYKESKEGSGGNV